MYILGLSGLYHDSAAALIRDGYVLSAVQEERFTRRKNDRSFPVNAIRYCLQANGVRPEELTAVVFYDNPLKTLDRFLDNWMRIMPDDDDLIELQYERMFRDRLWIHKTVKEKCGSLGITGKLLVCDHHISHAASAFYTSGYQDAALLVVDAVGEWATISLGVGEGKDIRFLKQINYPDSLGMLYSAFTYFCGFKVNSGEYKLMGLAPYGKPVYSNLIKEHLITIRDDGSFHMNQKYFGYQYGRSMTEKSFEELFQISKKQADEPFNQKHLDMAASIQEVTEEILLKMSAHLKKLTEKENLCFAGGTALNCVANGKLLRQGLFKNLYIQPAAGDAGGALGAALYAYYSYFNQERVITNRRFSPYLGPSFSESEITNALDHGHAVYHTVTCEEELLEKTADCLAAGKVVGFFHGAMEYGPRALGHRSILGDPRNPEMQARMNQKIKFRESFRPFAPSVTEERAADFFDSGAVSPYMLLTTKVREDLCSQSECSETDIYKIAGEVRSVIPAVTHVDYSARVQTVSEEDDHLYYRLLRKFEEMTGVPVLVNTSFNVRGEPIVCTPTDAYACFMRTGMDVLVIENKIMYKEEQPTDEQRWTRTFEDD